MVTLYIPKIDELWFRQKMLEDDATMAFNHAYGGTISFPKERWNEWSKRWVGAGNERFYAYVKAEKDFVGEVAYRFDEATGHYVMSLIIFAPFRRRGYGLQALSLLCEEAKSQGIDVLYDDIAIDNPSISLFLRFGFIEENRTKDVVLLKKILYI